MDQAKFVWSLLLHQLPPGLRPWIIPILLAAGGAVLLLISMRRPAQATVTAVSTEAWDQPGWFGSRCRMVIYRIAEPRGLAFIGSLIVTWYVAIFVPVRPLTDMVALVTLTGGIYTGAWLGSLKLTGGGGNGSVPSIPVREVGGVTVDDPTALP